MPRHVFTEEDRRRAVAARSRNSQKRQEMESVQMGDAEAGSRILARLTQIALTAQNVVHAIRAASVALPYLFPRFRPEPRESDIEVQRNLAAEMADQVKRDHPDLDVSRPYVPAQKEDTTDEQNS